PEVRAEILHLLGAESQERAAAEDDAVATRSRARRTAWDCEVFVALTNADGTPADERAIGLVRKRLRERFGWFFFHRQSVSGGWQIGNASLRGEIAVFRIIVEEREQPKDFFLRLKEELAKELQFADIAIVARRAELI